MRIDLSHLARGAASVLLASSIAFGGAGVGGLPSLHLPPAVASQPLSVEQKLVAEVQH
jgi:hypothetical protein